MRRRPTATAWQTLGRELESLRADVGRGGSGIGRRIEDVHQLVTVIGTAARSAPAAEHATTVTMLGQLLDQQRALTTTLQAELSRIGGELAQLRAGSDATERYGAASRQVRVNHLDRVG